MRWSDAKMRLHALFRRARMEHELHEELDFHLAMEARKHTARGAAPGRAARQAQAAFGAADRVAEECRDARGLRWLEDAAADLRFALRRLRRAPAFAAVAILTLALGIGANTALFTLVDAVLLRSLPVSHPEQLALLGNPDFTGVESGVSDHEVDGLTYNQFVQLRAQNHNFSGLAAFSAYQPALPVRWGATVEDAVPLKLVSANYFHVLGLVPARGRFFPPSADSPTAAGVAVMSYGYWQTRFGGNPAVVGRSFRLQQQEFTVIGVAPRGFAGTTVGQAPALYLPMALQGRIIPGRDWLHDPPGITRIVWLLAMGRLRPGASLAQARAECAVIFAESVGAQARAAADASTRAGLLTQWLPVAEASAGASALRETFAQPLLILLALVGLVLLVVVVNLGGMLLAQAAAREREFALRTALGAGRGRLVRQMLAESLLLAAIGGAGGWMLAQTGERTLVGMVAGGAPGFALPLRADAGVLAFTLTVCLLAGIGIGFVPALQLTRRDLARRAARVRSGTAGAGLVVVQTAFAIVLVTAAALFVRSLQHLRAEPLGFRPGHLITFNVNAATAGAGSAHAGATIQRIADALRRLPGVTGATYSENGLFTGGDSGDDVTFEGYADSNASPHLDSVAPGYFAVLGIPILRGREFTPADRGRPALPMVIDETVVRRYFAGRDPLGQMATVHFSFGDASYRIVGVAGHVQQQDLRERTSIPRVYFDIENRGAIYPVANAHFEVRTDAAAGLDPTRIHALLANTSGFPLQLTGFTTVQGLIDAALQPDELLARLAGSFALLALGLAAMGLYAMLSYAVARRRAELAIRMALGARASEVVAMVLRHALGLLALGIALGAAASLAVGRSLASLLFQLRPSDPTSLAAAALLLFAAGLAAACVPALRASRTDPVRTLRES